jgi:hypothetical protein
MLPLPLFLPRRPTLTSDLDLTEFRFRCRLAVNARPVSPRSTVPERFGRFHSAVNVIVNGSPPADVVKKKVNSFPFTLPFTSSSPNTCEM